MQDNLAPHEHWECRAVNRERKRLVGCMAVAMAVMAALACFTVVPNIGRALHANADNKCFRELFTIDAALAKLITDANVNDVRGLFDANEFARAREAYAQRAGLDAFEASAEIYTTVLTSLLRHGRYAADELSASEDTKDLAGVIKRDVLPRVGHEYLEVRKDPWGTPYHFFGPWPEEWGPIIFRVRQVPDEAVPGAHADALTVSLTDKAGSVRRIGFPAQSPKELYIWSLGPNRLSDQARFDPEGQYLPPASRHYRYGAAPEDLGGGDDLNNWDRGQSWNSVHDAMSPYRKLWCLIR